MDLTHGLTEAGFEGFAMLQLVTVYTFSVINGIKKLSVVADLRNSELR
jgi:hypothetical protein